MSGDWPPLGPHLDDFGGDWSGYQAYCYAEYERDFLTALPSWPVAGQRFAIKRQPLVDGQCHTFWHIITDGDNEESRTPDLDRCARVCWPRTILDEFHTTYPRPASDRIVWWLEQRGNEWRYHIALRDFSYLVVVADRGSYVLLWTAFPIQQNHQRRRRAKAYANYWASKG